MLASLRPVLLLALVVPLLSSCAPAAPPATAGRHAIINGEIDEVHTSVVALTVFGSSEFCSGTVIAPRAVLTAAHCIAGGYDPAAILVFFGTTVGGEGQLMRVTAADYDPEFSSDSQGYVYHDVAVLTLEQDAPVPPMAWQRTPLEDIAGATVTFVGYGVTDARTQTGNDTRRTVDGVVDSINDYYVHFAGNGVSGTCQGDSGGPTLLDRGGVPTVIAVTSIGVVGCVYESDNTRVDLHADFIAPLAPMPVEIKVSEPAEGAWVGSAFNVSADATSPTGSVTEVALYLDNEPLLTCPAPPCTFELRDVPDGDHIVTLKATAADGGTGRAEVWVTVVTQEFGIGCQANSDCKSGLCAEWQAGEGYCSQTCEEDADCPVHSNCEIVWQQKACGRPGSNPGCTASGSTRGGAAALLALGLLVGGVVLFRRRRLRGTLGLLAVATLATTVAACGDNRWGYQNDGGRPSRERPLTDGGALDAPVLEGIGAACTVQSEITQGDCNPGLICITEDVAPVAVNGYCVLPCGEGLGCPEGSTCVHGTTHSMFCLKSCLEDTDCRTEDGFRCMERDGAQVCWSWIVPPGTNDGGACQSPDGGPWVDSVDRTFGASQQLVPPEGSIVEAQPLVVAKGSTVAASFVSSASNFGGTRIAVTASQDQGATFGAAAVVADTVTGRKSDPILAIDPSGAHLYLGWIGYDRTGGTASNYHVFVARSDDAGLTWPTGQIVSAASTGTTVIARPWLATGPGGTVYVSYVGGTGATSTINVVRSTDDGATWGTPVVVNETRTVTSHGLPHVATNAAGDVFVGWGEVGAGEPNGDAANDIYVARWDSGGTWGTFGANVKANPDADLVVSNALAIVPAATSDKLYVVYVAGPPGSQRWDVRMAWSNDSGSTFAASSIKINDDPSCAVHVLPTAAVDAADRLHVAWYDKRFGLEEGGFFYSVFDPTAGTPSANEFVSDGTFNYSTETRTSNRLGLYAGLSVDGSHLYAVWADSRGVTNTSHIRFATGTWD